MIAEFLCSMLFIQSWLISELFHLSLVLSVFQLPSPICSEFALCSEVHCGHISLLILRTLLCLLSFSLFESNVDFSETLGKIYSYP